MAQKSITSFFTKTVPKLPVKSNSSDEDESSPVKQSTKIKRRRISSSDEENVIKSPPKKKGTPKVEENIKNENVDSKSNVTDTTPVKEKTSPKPISPKETPSKTKTPPKPSPTTTKKGKTPKSDKKTKKMVKESPKIKAQISASKTAKTDQDIADQNAEVKKQETKMEVDDKECKSRTESPSKMESPKLNSFFTSNKKDVVLQNAGQGLKGANYAPDKRKYDPINDAFWKKDEKVPYLALARTFELIEENSSRLRMIEILSNLFRSVIVLSPNDLLACVYLSLNQLAPAYEGLELGVAETTLMKAIGQTTGRTLAQIKTDAQATGDLGIVAERSRSNQRMMFSPAPHTVDSVYTKLKEIAKMTGMASMSKKVDKIQTMFVACRHSEARFLIRSLAGKLRIGLAEQSLLQALAQACVATPPNQKEYPPKLLNGYKTLGEAGFKSKLDEVALILKSTYCQCPNYNQIIPVLLEHGYEKLLEKCQMIPGTPLKPMLAQPTKGVHEVLTRFEGIKFTCEWKYDGERAQIHILEDGTVNIYSRNQENNTSKYPDVISRIDATKKPSVVSCIIDTEAVAWDRERKQILPFQILSTRKRKDANETEIKVQVCIYMFDLLYFNSEPLTKLPFIERRKLLHENFNEVEGEWKFATHLDTSDIDEVQTFLDESVKGNCEGLMVKTLEKDATYEIAKRSRNWLKLKKDYLAGVGDSLDLVVIGGYIGRGKRTGTYGGFLLACYDQENEEYQSICKIGTGFTDEDLTTHTEFLKPHVIKSPKSYFRYDSSHEPDDWFEPVQVWEVKCADLSLSPAHLAAIGIVDPDKGISLRFPRFIRIRDDKTVEDATSAQQVADMYSNQDQIKNQQNNGAKKNADDDDFY